MLALPQCFISYRVQISSKELLTKLVVGLGRTLLFDRNDFRLLGTLLRLFRV